MKTFEEMNQKELRAECKKAGITGYSKMTLAGMRELLEDRVVIPEVEVAKAALKIEKDRPEQNGVTRPSLGGKCRAVWDACDGFLEHTGRVPVPKEMKAWAVENGFNENNAVIEMYQWRKFNGLVRGQK